MLKRVPDLIDYEGTAKLVADDMSPLNVVLLQEVCVCVHWGREGGVYIYILYNNVLV